MSPDILPLFPGILANAREQPFVLLEKFFHLPNGIILDPALYFLLNFVQDPIKVDTSVSLRDSFQFLFDYLFTVYLLI